jgi:SAM-dependent methyltransferase
MVPLLRAAIAVEIDAVFRKMTAPAKVLDVGAGECPLRSVFEKYGARYYALDVAQNSSRTIDFCSAIDQPLPEQIGAAGPYDFIVCTEVMEHVPDWSQAFDNFLHLLVPGGYLLITTPFFYMLHEEPHDHWRATDHALKHFALKKGFEIDRASRLGDGMDVLGTLLGSVHICRKEKSFFAFFPTMLILILHRILLRLTRWPSLRRYTAVAGDWYLSNVVLLHKPRNNLGKGKSSP